MDVSFPHLSLQLSPYCMNINKIIVFPSVFFPRYEIRIQPYVINLHYDAFIFLLYSQIAVMYKVIGL